eukprot:177676-Rhodomonas_salina.1
MNTKKNTQRIRSRTSSSSQRKQRRRFQAESAYEVWELGWQSRSLCQRRAREEHLVSEDEAEDRARRAAEQH